ncbi:MAG: hypothetical protein AAFU61_08310, partial [Pseudomonadota bacterium]
MTDHPAAPNWSVEPLHRGFAQALRYSEVLFDSDTEHQRLRVLQSDDFGRVLTLDDGRTATTPIVEVKNLNSFRSVAGAIRYELKQQP